MTTGDGTVDVINYAQMFDGANFTRQVYAVPMTSNEITGALDGAMVQGGRVAAFFTVPMKVAAITETGMNSSDGVALLLGGVHADENGDGHMTSIALFMDDQTAASLGNHLMNWCSLDIMQQTLLERMQVDSEVPQTVLDEMNELRKVIDDVEGTDD